MPFRKPKLTLIAASITIVLTGCGGGGGGGNPYVKPSTPTVIPTAPTGPTVPYYTPTRVGSVTPINSPEYEYDSSALFSQNLSGGAQQEVIIAGRMAPDSGPHRTYNLSIFGWQNGTMVNRTSQWFSGSDNVIVGTEPSVKFADFNGDGKLDMYVAPNTDTNVFGPGAVFFNKGSSFSRLNLDLGNITGHDSAVYDMDRDGKADIFTLSFNNRVKISFGRSDGTFNTYTNTSEVGGGSGVAVADFMGNGTSSIIVTDSAGANRLFTWSINDQNLVLTQQSVLPASRFTLPKWSSYNFSGTHDIRALAFDFDNSGRVGAVVISRPWITNGQWPEYSEVQFLKNQGNGVFIDVTDTTLVGYNNKTPVSYNPTLYDVNNDGLIDIVLNAASWGSNFGPTVLVHTSEHKYVASYSTILKAFQDQAFDLERAIHNTAGFGANGIVFVQGPDNQVYLVTAISYADAAGVQQKAIYLSRLGNNSTNVQATVNAIKQTWPWMSDAQVNTVLAQSSTTWFGLKLLDPAQALRPIGSLSIPLLNHLKSLDGFLGGINLNGQANGIRALDSLGRDFVINYSVTNRLGTNVWSRFVDDIEDDTRGSQPTGMQYVRYDNFKFNASPDNLNQVLGITNLELGRGVKLSTQFTRAPFSPFVQMSGAWGQVVRSNTYETAIAHAANGWISKAGLLYTITDINPGLVTKVNPITSVWAEVGYKYHGLQIHAGMLPKVLSGSVDMTLPTGIDMQGRIQYTNTQANLHSPIVNYLRFSHIETLSKVSSLRFHGMATTQKTNSLMAEYRYNF